MPLGAKIFDIAFTVFVYLVAAAILFGAVLFAFNTSSDKALFGYRYYTIRTGSMSPTYNVGDMIFVKLSDANEINVGDVITFNPAGNGETYLTHRVAEKIDNYENTGITCFKTKGDANEDTDSFLIDADRVIGKVTFSIPGLGYVVTFIQMRWYLIIPVIIMIAVFFLLLKRYFLMGKEDDDKEKTDKKGDERSSESAESVDSAETADTQSDEIKEKTAPAQKLAPDEDKESESDDNITETEEIGDAVTSFSVTDSIKSDETP